MKLFQGNEKWTFLKMSIYFERCHFFSKTNQDITKIPQMGNFYFSTTTSFNTFLMIFSSNFLSCCSIILCCCSVILLCWSIIISLNSWFCFSSSNTKEESTGGGTSVICLCSWFEYAMLMPLHVFLWRHKVVLLLTRRLHNSQIKVGTLVSAVLIVSDVSITGLLCFAVNKCFE